MIDLYSLVRSHQNKRPYLPQNAKTFFSDIKSEGFFPTLFLGWPSSTLEPFVSQSNPCLMCRHCGDGAVGTVLSITRLTLAFVSQIAAMAP